MRIELDGETGLITINGIDIAFDALDILTKASPSRVYQFCREGDAVLVQSWRTEDIKFPEEQGPMTYAK
jgi:hypothetical protein